MLLDPGGNHISTMHGIIFITCALLLVSGFYSEVAFASSKYDMTIEGNSGKEPEKDSINFTPRIGRKKRNLKDNIYKASESELFEPWEVSGEYPTTIVTINGNDKYICRNLGNPIVEEKREDFIPRLGRYVDDPNTDRWIKDAEDKRYSFAPISPRLGRKLSQYRPRLGREA